MNSQQGQSSPSRKARYVEAAKHLGIPLSTLYALVHQKRVPHYRYGPRFVLFDLDELDQWMREHRVEVPADEAHACSEENPDPQGGDR